MQTPYKLPKKDEDLALTIEGHIVREETRMGFRRLTWLVAWYYINGARRFDVFNPDTGALTAHFVDQNGNMEYQSQELLSILDRTVGRLKEIDLWPNVSRVDQSLEGQRERATMQVLMDGVIDPNQLEYHSGKFIHLYTLLGSCGITGHIHDNPAKGLASDLEVIHPKELFPFPSHGLDYTKVNGLVRQRVVPYDWLKAKYGRRIADRRKDLEIYEVPLGSIASVSADEEEEGTGTGGRLRGNVAGASNNEDDYTIEVVKVRELWTMGPAGYCQDYVLVSNKVVIARENYEGLEAYCPIGIRSFIDTGTFHGAGLFDLLFSNVRELEKLLKSLYNNIRDIDKYGFLVLPHGGFNHDTLFKDVGEGLKVAYYEPDISGSDVKPFMVTPYNSGDAPGKVATLAKAMLEGISPIKDLAEEKGRIDSATGLQFLDEQMGRYMTNATNGLRMAFSDMYRGMASALLTKIPEIQSPVPVGKLTTDLAGVVIDPDTHTVSFETNPIPSLSRLLFGIRGRTIQSQTAKLARAVEMLEKGLSDPQRTILYFVKEGMEAPLFMEEEKAAYETVVQNILRLYGNGQQPGMLILTPHNVNPGVQLRILSAFMTSPMMALASTEVQNSFIDYRESLMQMMQPVLPPGVPLPDELAAIQQDIVPNMTGQQQQGAPSG